MEDLNITDYGFLKLLVSTIVLQRQTPVFENQKLQKDLYKFYDDPNFKFLFEIICIKEDANGNSYVDLGDAFKHAYAWGLLSMIKNNDGLKSIINLSREESWENILQFGSSQVKAMDKLVNELYGQKKVNKPSVLIKKLN